MIKQKKKRYLAMQPYTNSQAHPPAILGSSTAKINSPHWYAIKLQAAAK
jgi:hypothetical protein